MKTIAYKIEFDNNSVKYIIGNIKSETDIYYINNKVKNKLIKCQFKPNSCFQIQRVEQYSTQVLRNFIFEDCRKYSSYTVSELNDNEFKSFISHNNTIFNNYTL